MTTHYKKSREEGCCSVQFLKYVLFIFNFTLFLAGCVVLGVGLWTVIDKHQYVGLLSTSTYAAIAYILIIAGSITILVSFLGCAGVWKENRCVLILYTFFLLFIFLMEAVAGTLAYVYEDQVKHELETNLNATFLSNYKINDQLTNDIDQMQREFRCCGALSPDDWINSKWLKEDPSIENKVPDSCCKTENVGCGQSSHPSNIHDYPCISMFLAKIKEHLIILGAVGLGICIVQLFGMIFSLCLYIRLKDYDDSY